jgi:hypothetical protein
MRDEIEKLGDDVVRQARPAGMGTRGYAASAGGSARSGGAPSPGFVINEAGLAVRFFIPGRDPLYDPENPPPFAYILGAPTNG